MIALPSRVRFQQRALDDNDDRTGPWEAGFSVWANLDYQRGSESAIQNRLEERQPATIIIRDSTQARLIAPRFRAIVEGGARDGEVFNVASVVPAREVGFLNIVAVSGGADG